MEGHRKSQRVNSEAHGYVRYLPSEEEAAIIKSYFRYNNFQDFNTWQQISKSKCEFHFLEKRESSYECKAILQWDDHSMPVISEIGQGKNRRSSKKKALLKLINTLIFSGLISLGFKGSDFVRRLPKRRRECSESESEERSQLNADYQVGQEQEISANNFIFFAAQALHHQRLRDWQQIICRLQNKTLPEIEQVEEAIQPNENLPSDEPWQDYCERQLKNPLEEDLADILRHYQLQLPKIQLRCQPPRRIQPLRLPSDTPFEGINLFQSFQPIEASFELSARLKQLAVSRRRPLEQKYFAGLEKSIVLPQFDQTGRSQTLAHKTIDSLLKLILQFSYNHKLSHQALVCVESQINRCDFGYQLTRDAEQYYLRHRLLLTAELSFEIGQKSAKVLKNGERATSMEGMLSWQQNGLMFRCKEPEEIWSKKVAWKGNTNEVEDMEQFATEEYVLLVSKIDPSQIYIGQLLQVSPAIKLRCLSFLKRRSNEKHPFTMLKILNAKVHNRICKAIIHQSRDLSKIGKRTLVIDQPPTFPLLNTISDLLAEWSALGETTLVVSDRAQELHASQSGKGFKALLLKGQVEEKQVAKSQIVFSSLKGTCSEAIKNYAYTRVLIEGAQRIPETFCLLPLDKGCELVCLLGDSSLPQSTSLSPFARMRRMGLSLMARLLQTREPLRYVSSRQQHMFDQSILRVLSNEFYGNNLNMSQCMESPLVKGFPWPSVSERVAFIHSGSEDEQAELCCQILANVLKSGFISQHNIGCRSLDFSGLCNLRNKIRSLFQSQIAVEVNMEALLDSAALLTGSRLQQRHLLIALCGSRPLPSSYLNACLQEGSRGVIILGDMQKLATDWGSSVRWAIDKRLILSVDKGREAKWENGVRNEERKG